MNVSSLATRLGMSFEDRENIESDLVKSLPDGARPETTTYPDSTYVNYYPLGISLCYANVASSSSNANVLSQIDLYNPPPADLPPRKRRKDPSAAYTAPRLPIVFNLPDPVLLSGGSAAEVSSREPNTNVQTEPGQNILEVDGSTTAKDFVASLGEPSKKSEGEPGYIPAYLEWDKVSLLADDGSRLVVGVMVELRDPGAQSNNAPGASVWDRAHRWTWSSLKLFQAEPDQGYVKPS